MACAWSRVTTFTTNSPVSRMLRKVSLGEPSARKPMDTMTVGGSGQTELNRGRGPRSRGRGRRCWRSTRSAGAPRPSSRSGSSPCSGARPGPTPWLAAAAGRRRRPHPARLAPARAHAQPDRRGRRGGVARRARSTATTATSGTTIAAELAADTVDLLLVSPERFANAPFRETMLPRARAARRHARGRRGALHQRLGSRLPARLPPHRSRPRPAPSGVPVLGTTATANDRVVAREESCSGGPPSVWSQRRPKPRPTRSR